MILNFTDPFFSTRVLGFEPLFDRLQRLSESNDRSSSYPPYNISKDGNLFAIEIAVAGLSKDDIEIELADGVLSVSYDGPKSEVINGEKPVIEVKEHWIPGSKHIILTFKNGYGASIIPEYRYPKQNKNFLGKELLF